MLYGRSEEIMSPLSRQSQVYVWSHSRNLPPTSVFSDSTTSPHDEVPTTPPHYELSIPHSCKWTGSKFPPVLTSFCTPPNFCCHWHQNPSCFDQFGSKFAANGSKNLHEWGVLRRTDSELGWALDIPARLVLRLLVLTLYRFPLSPVAFVTRPCVPCEALWGDLSPRLTFRKQVALCIRVQLELIASCWGHFDCRAKP